MNISYNTDKYFDEFLDIAYQKYYEEVTNHTFLEKKSKSSFSEFFNLKFKGMKYVVATENDKCIGFIVYSLQDDGDNIYCNIPVWGYGSNSEKPEKTIGYLFQNLAEQIVLNRKTNFSIRVYAHDYKIQTLFSHMQFGIISEKAVRRISEIVKVRKISKDELILRWDDIWDLLKQLINHLKKSPIFYPCNEFTEDIYKGFMTDDETTVYIAEDEHKIIGLIEANLDNLYLVFYNSSSANVGEAFVLPEYRGRQVAQALLNYLENDLLSKHIRIYDWVEHGTANPTARGFWNKYFETIEYEFIRSV